MLACVEDLAVGGSQGYDLGKMAEQLNWFHTYYSRMVKPQ